MGFPAIRIYTVQGPIKCLPDSLPGGWALAAAGVSSYMCDLRHRPSALRIVTSVVPHLSGFTIGDFGEERCER